MKTGMQHIVGWLLVATFLSFGCGNKSDANVRSASGSGGSTSPGSGGSTSPGSGGSNVSNELCGNGELDTNEECDPTVPLTADCSSHGFDTGSVSCTASCRIDVSECTGTLTPVIELSRESCVAPCAIFFDARSTSGLAENDITRATFSWDFDVEQVDPDTRFAATRGFVAAHVYRQPGTYQVSLRVRDVEGHAGSTTINVQVDANTGPTLHVAANGSDDASGELDAPLASPEAALQRAASESTILLRRGDEFSLASVQLQGDGPFLLGSYADPAQPSTSKPVLRSSASSTAFSLSGSRNQTIMDVHVIAESASTGFGAQGSEHVLLLDVEMEGVRNGEGVGIYTGEENDVARAFTVQGLDMHDFDRYGIYGTAYQLALIGSRMVRFGGGHHGVRINAGEQIYFGHNYVFGDDTFNSFTLRGNRTGTTLTDAVLIANHAVNAVTINPQNFHEDERIYRVLVDGNRFEDGLGIMAQGVVARNNLFFSSRVNISTGHPLLPEDFVRDIWIEHNTSYYPETSDETYFIVMGSTASNVNITNNLHVSLTSVNHSRFIVANDASLENLTSGNNFIYMPNVAQQEPFWIGTQAYGASAWEDATGATTILGSDPEFVSTDTEHPEALRPAAGDISVDSGSSSSVFTDIVGNLRPLDGDGDGSTAWDIGAYEQVSQ